MLQLNPETFVKETPGHEAAHIIAMELFGFEGTGHGRKWKEVMRVIGQQAKVYHNMATIPTAKYTENKAAFTLFVRPGLFA